ncbi:hypothetical protein LIA77_08150 [Sarocladium implicatum]|nr:hypothetical protein LIA77_08150 [Sarocladium implicatum]
MSRVTQLSRSIPSSLQQHAASAARASPLLDSTAHAAGAYIMPKYADLLTRRSQEHHDSRSITTTHRPTPQPSIANRSRPLMQTFTSSASRSSPSSALDATVIPDASSLSSSSSSQPVDFIRVPLLPDNYSAVHTEPTSAPLDTPEVTIVASDPENVSPGSGLAEVASAGGADAVDLGFARWGQQEGAKEKEDEGNMLTDLWKGMIDDVFGAAAAAAAPKKA